jgi:hypothetical protein
MRIAATLTALLAAGTITSFVAAGCGNTTSGAEGISCTEQSDCSSGLTCLPYFQADDGGCTNLGTLCLQTCANDEDCANLALGFVCVTACGGTPVCEPPMFFSEASTDAPPVTDATGPVDAQGQ